MSSDKAAIKKRIESDEDFIVYPKMGNSVSKLLARYPDGVEDSVILKCLMMTQEEFDAKFQQALQALRKGMGVKA
jgi:hypothetical protein